MVASRASLVYGFTRLPVYLFVSPPCVFLFPARCFYCASALSIHHHPLSAFVFAPCPPRKALFCQITVPTALRPSSLSCEGRNYFGAFLAVVCCALRPFPCAEAVYSRSDVEFPYRCAGFSVGRGGATLAWWLAFALSCRTSRRFALRFRVFAPSARVASTASHPFVAGCGKSAPISTYPQFVFHRLVHPVEKLFTTPCVFLPAFPFSLRRAHRPPPTRQPKAPLARAYIYIGVAKGEKDSAPSAAFRCGRGRLGAWGADRWPRPMDKGLVGGQGARKGVGERAVRGAAGAAIGRRQAKVPGGAHGVCTRVATVGEEEGSPGRCACTIRAQRQVELPNEVCKL